MLAIAAFAVSVIALFVGLYASRVARHVEESGFKAEEQFKADMVALLSALRSIIVKGSLSAADSTPLSVEKEIDTIRTFQASTSGLALAAWAARQCSSGPSKDATAGRWRTLSLNLGNLAGAMADDPKQGGAAFNVMLRSWATEVELTLEDLTENSVRIISKNIGDLPGTFAALKESRENDILLKAWFDVYRREKDSHSPEIQRRRLKHLQESGIDDPDLDMWLALLSDSAESVDDLKAALDRGANSAVSLSEVLARYEGNAHEESANPASGEGSSAAEGSGGQGAGSGGQGAG
jgi:hypothetical protein